MRQIPPSPQAPLRLRVGMWIYPGRTQEEKAVEKWAQAEAEWAGMGPGKVSADQEAQWGHIAPSSTSHIRSCQNHGLYHYNSTSKHKL